MTMSLFVDPALKYGLFELIFLSRLNSSLLSISPHSDYSQYACDSAGNTKIDFYFLIQFLRYRSSTGEHAVDSFLESLKKKYPVYQDFSNQFKFLYSLQYDDPQAEWRVSVDI